MSNAPGSAHKYSPSILTHVKLGSDLCQKGNFFCSVKFVGEDTLISENQSFVLFSDKTSNF